jgi:hypothetical protein
LGAVIHEIEGVLLLNSCATVALVIFNHIDRFYAPKGPFIIYDRGWSGKIQLITKQNVLTRPLHHKKIQ